MMRWLFLLYVVALGTLCAQSVTTWGGLRFGMTQAQVRAVLGSKMLKPGPDGQPLDKSSHDFTGGTVEEFGIKGFEGHVSLLFDKSSKKLSMITLFLAPLKDLTDEDRLFAYIRLRGDLLKKYGSPAGRDLCEEEKETACHLIFQSGGQAIDAAMYLRRDIPEFVYVVYEPSGAIKGNYIFD